VFHLAKTAIRPNYFNEFANVEAILKVPKGKDPEQEALLSLSNHSGWQVLKQYIERIMEELDNLTKTQMAQGVSFEEIGRSTVVKEITKDALRRIIQRVEDARESGQTTV
jgi:hypothetical protein